VEVDETVLVRRKYNRGRLPVDNKSGKQLWVFGGIERGTSNCFIVPVEKRDKETLLSLIEQHVLPGSTVVSDMWRGYAGLRDHPKYRHLTVLF
jgi:transposase-like protein